MIKYLKLYLKLNKLIINAKTFRRELIFGKAHLRLIFPNDRVIEQKFEAHLGQE